MNANGYDYDVIVLGAGSPGEHCAEELADGGLAMDALSAGEVASSAVAPVVFEQMSGGVLARMRPDPEHRRCPVLRRAVTSG